LGRRAPRRARFSARYFLSIFCPFFSVRFLSRFPDDARNRRRLGRRTNARRLYGDRRRAVTGWIVTSVTGLHAAIRADSTSALCCACLRAEPGACNAGHRPRPDGYGSPVSGSPLPGFGKTSSCSPRRALRCPFFLRQGGEFGSDGYHSMSGFCLGRIEARAKHLFAMTRVQRRAPDEDPFGSGPPSWQSGPAVQGQRLSA